ncbi:MAG: hypothetical protein KatS3mg011_0029 [Acidimicrobiia bacterium]|jgi:hypothetical protein|nr:MAG: hypothetical protein KatS3mg011_0029 [Acidimicrobiia bacterium]
MRRRFQIIGLVLAVLGLVFLVAGGVAFAKSQEGYRSLEKFSAAQNVTLSYDEEGRLIDRGTPEGAQAILDMLRNEWGYPVNEAELDPADPLVNTPTEYMYQMATIVYHVRHGEQTVVLTEDVEYDGQVFPAGEYTITPIEVGSPERVAAGLGGYWTDFDRLHPIEGPARNQAWSGTVHGLVAELGVGTTTATMVQLATALAGAFAGMGLVSLVAGIGFLWVARGREETLVVIPTDTRPEPAGV